MGQCPNCYICETCDGSGELRWLEAECCRRPHYNGECCGDPEPVECRDVCPECTKQTAPETGDEK